MFATSLLIPFALLAADPAARTDAPPTGDRAALVGTWKILEFHDDGGDKIGRLTGRSLKPTDPPEAFPRLVFTANECYVMRPSKAGYLREMIVGLTNVAWTSCTLDEKATPTRTIEITSIVETGSTKPPLVYAGIYELKGKQLRICWNESGVGPNGRIRPKEFKSDGAMNLLICKKLSDEPEKPVGEYNPRTVPLPTPNAKRAEPK